MRSLIFILLFSMTSSVVTAAPMQTFRFDDPAKEEVFKRLSHEIRCLVCQNQAIGDSNADLAQDLRQEIFDMLQQGKSEQEIVDFLVERYGDFVLYNPPMKPMTWVLWFGPILMFFIASFYAWRFVRRHQAEDTPVTQISSQDEERLKALQSEMSNQQQDRNE